MGCYPLGARMPIGKGDVIWRKCHFALGIVDHRWPLLLIGGKGQEVDWCSITGAGRLPFQKDVRRAKQERIMVDCLAVVAGRFGQIVVACIETDRPARAGGCTGGAQPVLPPIGAQVAFYRMVIDHIIAHRAIGTGYLAFTAACATGFVNRNHTGIWIFGYCLWYHWACPQAGRSFTMLTGQGQEIEAWLSGLA